MARKKKVIVDELNEIRSEDWGLVSEIESELREYEFGRLERGSDRGLLGPSKLLIQMQLHFEDFSNKCKDGFLICISSLRELALHDDEIQTDRLKRKMGSLPKKFDSLEKIQQLGLQLIEGKTWRELLDFHDDILQMLYRGASHVFEQKQYADAEFAFSFLTTLDPTQYAFWIGLGHAAYHSQHPDVAINAYAMASFCLPNAIWPHIYAANVFEAHQDKQHALLALQEADRIYQENNQGNKELAKTLKQRIAALQKK